MVGEWPENQVDHINHIRNDNRWINLREVTHQENNKNCSLRVTNTSGFMGICWDTSRGLWKSQIMVDGKTKYLGRFKDKKQAIKARQEANILYNFHENHGGLV